MAGIKLRNCERYFTVIGWGSVSRDTISFLLRNVCVMADLDLRMWSNSLDWPGILSNLFVIRNFLETNPQNGEIIWEVEVEKSLIPGFLDSGRFHWVMHQGFISQAHNCTLPLCPYLTYFQQRIPQNFKISIPSQEPIQSIRIHNGFSAFNWYCDCLCIPIRLCTWLRKWDFSVTWSRAGWDFEVNKKDDIWGPCLLFSLKHHG